MLRQVDLLVTAPNGQQSGIVPSNGNSVGSIAQSVVYMDAPEDTPGGGPGESVAEFVDLFQPQAGTYQLQLGGTTQDVPYTIVSDSISTAGTVLGSQTSISGTVTPDNIATDQQSFASFAPVQTSPTVTGISPGSGPVVGGTLVTITGTGFTGATQVDFGSRAATGVSVISDSQITATSPAGSGMVDVTVTTPGGTSALNTPADRYSYVNLSTPSFSDLSLRPPPTAQPRRQFPAR